MSTASDIQQTNNNNQLHPAALLFFTTWLSSSSSFSCCCCCCVHARAEGSRLRVTIRPECKTSPPADFWIFASSTFDLMDVLFSPDSAGRSSDWRCSGRDAVTTPNKRRNQSESERERERRGEKKRCQVGFHWTIDSAAALVGSSEYLMTFFVFL